MGTQVHGNTGSQAHGPQHCSPWLGWLTSPQGGRVRGAGVGIGTGWGESESKGVTTCLWSREICGALATRAETLLVCQRKFTGLSPEDALARECFGQEVPAEGMDFPSPLMYRVPQMMAMIAHHSESFQGPCKLRAGLREAQAEGAGRSCRARMGWLGQGLRAGGAGGDGEPSWTGSILYPTSPWLCGPPAWCQTVCRDPAKACGSDEFISIYDLL